MKKKNAKISIQKMENLIRSDLDASLHDRRYCTDTEGFFLKTAHTGLCMPGWVSVPNPLWVNLAQYQIHPMGESRKLLICTV